MAQEIEPHWLADLFGESKEIPAEKIERLQSAIFPTVVSLWVQAIREMSLVNGFFEQTKETLKTKKEALEQEIKKTIESGREFPDSLLLDFPVLEDFTWLSSEFAIVGLWRCVELYRTKAIRHALNDPAILRSLPKKWRKRYGKSLAKHIAKSSHMDPKSSFTLTLAHDDCVDILSKWEIKEQEIHCAEPVKELHLLNNAIKHQRQVTDSLAEISGWKEGDELGDLESHYRRLQPLAERYLEDLKNQLSTKFPPPYGVKNVKKG